jgi:hypothetical protein
VCVEVRKQSSGSARESLENAVVWGDMTLPGRRDVVMRRTLVRNVFFLAIAAVLAAGSLFAVFVARAAQNPRVELGGQTVPLIQRAHFLQAANPDQTLNLSISLHPRDAAGLTSLLHAIYTPGSAEYHHYLTPAEFQQQFAPTSDQVQQVSAFLQSQHVSVGTIAPNNLLIDATASVASAQQAFQVQINNYQFDNHTFYANAQAPTIPATLQALIVSIGGLDNSVQYQPLSLEQGARTADASGYGPAELSQAYDTTPFASVSIQGENQTVALFELDGYQQSDIQQYFQNYNLGTPNVSNVLVDSAKGAAGAGAIEVELDIEVVGAMAPHANQLVYEGPNTTQGLNDTYNRIVTDNKAQVLSTSWGLCESSTGNAELQTLDTIFQQAAAQGIAIYAAAGDSGAYDCDNTALGVDSPADDPYVTGVGGTNLQLGANNSYGSETVWSNAGDTQRGPEGAGGGGGISDTFTQPAWQLGTGVISSYSSGQPCNASAGQYCRQVPDVSADADPASGYAVYCTVTNAGCSSSGWITVGGTSAAAPFWAGSTALINEYLQSQGISRIGSANAALYVLFNGQETQPAFHDVTAGTNLYYPATTGYDMASGIGSPDVNNLAQDLAINAGGGTPTPTPTPAPTGTPTVPTPTPTGTPTPAPSPAASLIQNGGFENGVSPWQASASGNYAIISTLKSHTGKYSAYLCGYTSCKDQIAQTFPVPSVYNSLNLSYWWYSSTTQFFSHQCLDTLNVIVQTVAGKVIDTLQHDCNNDVTNAWKALNFDLTVLLKPYKGQRVTLLFSATTRADIFLTTSFCIDDVALVSR